MKTIQPTILFFVWGPVPSAEDYEEVAALEEQGMRVKMRNDGLHSVMRAGASLVSHAYRAHTDVNVIVDNDDV